MFGVIYWPHCESKSTKIKDQSEVTYWQYWIAKFKGQTSKSKVDLTSEPILSGFDGGGFSWFLTRSSLPFWQFDPRKKIGQQTEQSLRERWEERSELDWLFRPTAAN